MRNARMPRASPGMGGLWSILPEACPRDDSPESLGADGGSRMTELTSMPSPENAGREFDDAMDRGDYYTAIKIAPAFADAESKENATVRAIRGAIKSRASSELIRRMRARVKESRIIGVRDFDAIVTEAGRGKAAPDIGSHVIHVPAKGVWTYASGREECCEFCAKKAAGVYKDGDMITPLPLVIARVIEGTKAKPERHFMLARDADSPYRYVSWQDILSGADAAILDMPLPGDKQTIAARATAINAIAYGEKITAIQAMPRPDDRTTDGYLPIPPPEVLQPGYLDMPDVPVEIRNEGFRKFRATVAGLPKMSIVCGDSQASPYVRTSPSGQPRIDDLFGPSRQGKSTAVRVAASIWGNPRDDNDGIVNLWNTAPQGSGRYLGSVGFLPVYWEEYYESDREKRTDWIFNSTGGAIRIQAKQRGPGTNITPGWAGVMFVTSNARMLDGLGAGRSAGTLARVVEWEAPFTENETQAEFLKENVLSHYGYIGPRGMRLVTPEQFHALTRSAMEALNAPSGGVAGTIARHICEAVAGAIIIDMVLDEIIGPGESIADAAMIAAERKLAEIHSPKSDGERLLECLAEAMASEPSFWPTEGEYSGATGAGIPRGKLSGVRDAEYAYVFRNAWRKMAGDAGIDLGIAQSELWAGGAGPLCVPPGQRAKQEWTAFLPRWAGGNGCYKVRMDALIPPDDAGPEAPAASEPPPAPSGPLPAAPAMPRQMPLPVAPDAGGPLSDRRAAWVEGAIARKAVTTPDQIAALAERLRILDENDDPDSGELANSLRLLDALEGKGKGQSGPFAPFMAGKPPLWRPDLPDHILEATVSLSGYGWERKSREKRVRLDRNAAWVASTSSARLAHGKLEHSGEMELPQSGELAPGLYKMTAYPWHEPGMPNPFPGPAVTGQDYWLLSPAAELLRDLAKANRWPDSVALDSWTGRKFKLSMWAHFVREVRAYAREHYGPDSTQYDGAKRAYGKALSLMRGRAGDKPGQHVHDCKNSRRDWAMMIEAQSAVTLWRDADKIGCAIALKNVDELHIPAKRLAEFTEGERAKLRLDPTGQTLGTYKIKGDE
jgi:hypothetical protein